MISKELERAIDSFACATEDYARDDATQNDWDALVAARAALVAAIEREIVAARDEERDLMRARAWETSHDR